jgi:hypothetical protein
MTSFHILLDVGLGPQPIVFNTKPLEPHNWGWAKHRSRGVPEYTFEFPTFEEAQVALSMLEGYASHGSYQFSIGVVGGAVSDLDWRTREQMRFSNGLHTPAPWHNEPWYQAKHNELFCHISKKQPGSVAFTENAAKGAADRQTPMRPGRFLNKFFSDVLTNEQIEGWCAELSVRLAEDELKITQDADEVEEVYLGGPDSCMSKSLNHYSSPVHPVRVYAGPDLALAYLGSRDDAKARCVVWPERKIYSRLYGDVSRLKIILEDAGYSEGALDGARIQRIEYGNGFVVPYIDRGEDLDDDGDYLVIGRGGISSFSTDGTAGNSWMCPHCENDRDEDEASYVSDAGETWCSSCVQHHTFYCEYSTEYYSEMEQEVTLHTATYRETVIHQDYLQHYGAVYLDGRSEWWSSDHCFTCEECGEVFHNDDLVDHNGESLCEGCHDNLETLDDADEDQHNAHVLSKQAFDRDLAGMRQLGEHWRLSAAHARYDMPPYTYRETVHASM